MFPNEHVLRCAHHEYVRREVNKFGTGIHAVWGVLPRGALELASIHFDAEMFTPVEAKAWLRSHKYGVKLEKATGVSLRCSGEPFRVAGPIGDAQRFIKDIIRVGEYYKESDAISFAVTAEMLDNWVLQFQTMKANGVKVAMPDTHANAGSGTHNMGWVDEMFIDGDRLFAVCTLIGDDAQLAASRSDVSIYCPAKYIDGEGHEYLRPIVHVALCTDPVIPGLGEFIPLAASQGEFAMWELLVAFAKELGVTGDFSQDKPEDLLAAIKEKVTPPKKEEEEPAVASLSRMKSLIADVRKAKLDALVLSSHLTPAVRDRILKLYTTDAVLSLSTREDDGFNELILALADNNPVSLREKTGVQALVDKNNITERNAMSDEVDRRVKGVK